MQFNYCKYEQGKLTSTNVCLVLAGGGGGGVLATPLVPQFYPLDKTTQHRKSDPFTEDGNRIISRHIIFPLLTFGSNRFVWNSQRTNVGS